MSLHTTADQFNCVPERIYYGCERHRLGSGWKLVNSSHEHLY